MVDEILPETYDITLSESDGRRYRAYLADIDVPTLIDTGLEDTTEALFEGIDAVGLDPARVIITHGDPDHIGGLSAVVERYDVETWVPAPMDVDEGPAPDHTYGDGDRIGPFEAVYTPGHEPEHHSLVNEVAGYVLAGDAVFGGDLRGLPPGYLIPPPALYTASVNQAEESMEALLDYEFTSVLVYHGSSVLDDGYDRLNAFINFPGKPGWAEYQS